MSSDTSRPSTPDSSHASSRAPSPIWDDRKPIDKNLPPVFEVTLGGWREIWNRLDQSGDTHARDTFALTGHFTDPVTGKRRRAQINLEGCRPSLTDTTHQISDVDSVISKMTGRVPIRESAIIKHHMLLSPSHTLRKDTHTPGVMVDVDHRIQEEVPLHKMPNTRLLSLEPQGLIRIHFPYLKLPGGNVCPDEDHMRQWYDLVWRPAAEEVLPEELLRDWAASYNDEKFRASTKKSNDKRKEQDGEAENVEQRGTHHQDSGRDLHAEFLNPLLEACHRIIGATPRVEWARGFVLGYEMRGLKNRVDSMHPPPDDYLMNEDGTPDYGHPRSIRIKQLLKNFDTEQFEENSWFLDLATRVVVSDTLDSPAACTFASSDMHARLLCFFTNLPYDECLQLTSGRGNKFREDEVAQFNNISGGQLINPQWRESGVISVQIYTTDKNPIYNVALAHGAQRTSARLCLLSYSRELSSHIDPLLVSFHNSSLSHGVALRIESRVAYEYYPYCQLRIPDDVLKPCLYRIEREDFWGWKVARLTSIKSVMSEWMAQRSTFILPSLPVAGTLLLSLQFMLNALVNRPDSGSHWDEVHDYGCVHAMQNGQLVPQRPLGAYFLPVVHFKQNRQPRASTQRTLPLETICYLLGTKDDRVSQMDVYNMIKAVTQKRRQEEDPKVIGPARVGNRQRRVVIRSIEEPEDQFVGLLPTPEAETYPSEEEDPEEREAVILPTKHLTDLVHSYPTQMIAKAPNRFGGGSWCSLTAKQRREVQFNFFGSMDTLKRAYESHILIPLDVDKWQRTLDELFPLLRDGPGHNPEEKGQGLKTLTVRKDFITLQRGMQEHQRLPVVKSVHDYVSRHWLWLPYVPAKNNLWPVGTTAPKSAQRVGPLNGGPWIVLNPLLAEE
ncbi:hypothetical protein FRC11_014272 [Ceratobasidium sp. 423]|nr:hypothetical protein FRC11_014272 [Ceratobasidium sp. 423]